MNNISEYISEKLIISKDTHFKKELSYDEYPIKVQKKSGEKYQWFQWWEHLKDNGPMSKHDLLTDFKLTPTSYSTMFADLSKRNIIVPVKGKLEAKDPSEWKERK